MRHELSELLLILLSVIAGAVLLGCTAPAQLASEPTPPGPEPSVCGDGVVDDDELCDDGVNDALGGGCLPGCQDQDLTDEVFARDLLEVEIEIDPADWEVLRHQYKTPHVMFAGEDCRQRPVETPYTWMSASVTIDGVTMGDSGLRKKGHIGSQSTTKPSLKLDFDRFVPGQRFHTTKRLALNNSKNDPSYMRSCLAYSVFHAAGIPAPLCTYARVRVNGSDLGIYFAVEEMRNRFLQRTFVEPGGNLYEGTACDFRPEFFGGFEQETNELSDPSRADLQAVYDVVQGSADADLESDLDRVIDVAQFYRFWATEVLVWHRDGYGGNANNYNVYANPADDGRIQFIPWGPDSAFRAGGPSPRSVLASGVLANRLYGNPETRLGYYGALLDLLDEAWDEAALLAEVDRVAALLQAHVLPEDLDRFTTNVQDVRTFIEERRGEIDAILADGMPDWTQGMRSLPCRVAVGTLSASFSTTWDSMTAPRFATGSGTMTLSLHGAQVPITQVNARGGPVNNGLRLEVYGTADDGRRYRVLVPYPDPRFFDPFMVPGLQDFTRPPVNASARRIDAGAVNPPNYELGQGTWNFTEIGWNGGDPLAATFNALIFERYPGTGQ